MTTNLCQSKNGEREGPPPPPPNSSNRSTKSSLKRTIHQQANVLPAKSDSDVMFCLQSYLINL